MLAAESTSVSIALLKERSRNALIEGLGAALTDMGQEEAITFLADLLLAAGADRDHLKQRLASLLSRQFGRRSEKSSAEQIELFAQALRIVAGDESSPEEAGDDDGTSAPKTAAELIEQTNDEIKALAAAQREERAAARQARRETQKLDAAANKDAVPWPTHLPIREETLEVPVEHRDCDDCGAERQIIRYQTSWRLKYYSKVEVAVTHTPIVACGSHHGGPLAAPVPPKPVDKGQLGFSLAAHILWRRITHNLPVRRIAEMLQAEGAPVSEQMIHTLITTTGERCKPLVDAIHAAVREAALVNIDDTHTDVHETQKGRRKRKRRRARVWLALGDERFAYFFATKTWKAQEVTAALGPISGVLQGDGYAGYPGYVAKHGSRQAGCMAHFRSKLRKAVSAHDPRATQAMALVGGLYRVEKLARLQELDADGRLSLRQQRSVPIMAELLDWAREVAPTIVKGSPLGKAWTYLDNQQKRLQVFLTDGSVSIDNNAAERGLRRHTIGRKLWLFFRDQDKLEHVARLMSVLTTARLHGIDELAYLEWVLKELARREWSAVAARELLPDAWRVARDKEAEELGSAEV